jgi:hypothetical protein
MSHHQILLSNSTCAATSGVQAGSDEERRALEDHLENMRAEAAAVKARRLAGVAPEAGACTRPFCSSTSALFVGYTRLLFGVT